MLRAALATLLLLAALPLHAEGLRTESTALVVTPLQEASWVPADDGKLHVEYDLLVVNTFPVSVTVNAIEVLDSSGRELGRFAQPALAESTSYILDRSKLRTLPANSAAIIEIDLALEGGPVPERLGHRILVSAPEADGALRALLTGEPMNGPEVKVRTNRPLSILPPVRGEGWVAFNGCCAPNVHRSARYAAGTRIAASETYAIDFIRLEKDLPFSGNGSENTDYPSFGNAVLAVAEGEVVAAVDGIADAMPHRPTRSLHAPVDLGGNFVLQRIAPDVYAFYGHLKQGSVEAKPGTVLKAGEKLGAIGSSGNSAAPHLQFGLVDRPDFLTGNAVPFVFPAYTLTGRISKVSEEGLDIEKTSEAVRSAYPLEGSIATYE
ncbi:M23 family metallopeptidase [Xanthobacter sediminis]|uniref:M23 family metallopeptidase n=1 Tax=Xanthobacter sediminis TaxID=3119926 RepID=UPI0037288D0A